MSQQLRQEGRQEGWQKGIQKGEEAGLEKTLQALKLLEEELGLEQVAQQTGLTIAQVQKIKQSLVQ